MGLEKYSRVGETDHERGGEEVEVSILFSVEFLLLFLKSGQKYRRLSRSGFYNPRLLMPVSRLYGRGAVITESQRIT